MMELLQLLIHPYPRYGLGVALYRAKPSLRDLDEQTLATTLADTIESGLNYFRMETEDKPGSGKVLTFAPIRLDTLLNNTKLVQASGLAAQGIYLYPSIVSTDGDAKGTFDNAVSIVKSLREGKSLTSPAVFSRSFAPTTAKINNGKRSLSEPRGTLIEAACSVITSITPIKPAAWVEGRNTVIIPDLLSYDLHDSAASLTGVVNSLSDLYDFIEMFNMMMTWGLKKNLMEAKMPSNPELNAQIRKPNQKASGEKQTKSEYRRPRLHNGNYPFAPQRDAAAFGAVGLLGAIGRWALDAGQTAWATRVLESIKNKPLYIISYDSITHVQFDHHVVGLAQNGKLSEIVQSLTYDTRLGKEIDAARPLWDDTNRRLFHIMSSRFLELFTASSFQDFLAFRTEYPANLKPLFQEYFMQTHEASDELKQIVQAAEEYGRWLNYTAYRTAKTELDKDGRMEKKLLSEPEKKAFWEKVKKEKAKIITVLESVAMSAKSGQAMIAQVSTQAGRLGQTDAPDTARPYLYAVMTGQIDFNDARQLLMVYMRLQSSLERKATPLPDSTEPTEQDDKYSLSIGDNNAD